MKSLEHVNIDSPNSLFLVFNNVGYIEESNGDKYLIFASTGKNKKVLEKYAKLLDEIKNQIETINSGEPIEYKNISRKPDDALTLGKKLSIPSMIIVIGSVLQEGNKYYPQVCLHDCVYESENEFNEFVQCAKHYLLYLI